MNRRCDVSIVNDLKVQPKTMLEDAVRPRDSNLWAISAYFNPTGYRRRLANYRTFRERLTVPLITVELLYGDNPELNDGDAEVLIQLRGRDVMWQKERLLNIALQALPDHCRNVVWLDCDLVFEALDWPEQLTRSLEQCLILQPFGHVYALPPDCLPGESLGEPSGCHPSVSFAVASGVPPAVCLGEIVSADGVYAYARGFAWAARRELLQRHGLYDACIVGNADRAIAGAVYGCYEQVMQFQHMNDRQRTRYLRWAEPFHESVAGRAGWMAGNVYHLWHGHMKNRGYQQRHEILPRFEFDPFQDIAVDGNGCWRWNTDKPQMHALVTQYFSSRKEDG